MEGDVVSKLRLDIADITHKLGRVEAMMAETMTKVQRTSAKTSKKATKDSENFMHVSRKHAKTFSFTWVKRFGEVAVGFSIAYRALNAVYAGIGRTLQSFVDGLTAIDDFRVGVINIAASLQMLTEAPSKKSLEAYMQFGEVMFKKMEILAIRHFATGEQLQMAFTKMATLGIVPQTERQLESMAALVDRILMATKGLDAGRQIMTEVQAVIEGMQRPGAVVARELKSLVPDYKELIAAMQQQSNITERTKMFLEGIAGPLAAVSSVSEEIMKTIQARLTSLKTASDIVLRAGLFQMYEDVVKAMKSMVDYTIDENGLTEEGVRLAYLYHAVWERTKSVMFGIRDIGAQISVIYKKLTLDIPLISGFFSAFHVGVVTLKYGLKSVLLILDEIGNSLSLGIDMKPFSTFFDEVQGKIKDPKYSPAEFLKIEAIAAGNYLDNFFDKWNKKRKEAASERGDLADRIAKKEEKLLESLASELGTLKAPEDWLDPKKLEAFAKKVRAQSKGLTKEILAWLEELEKGTAETSEKGLTSRLRREAKILRLEKSMHRDMLSGRLERIRQSAKDEYDIRVTEIKKLQITEKEEIRLKEMAEAAYEEKTLILHGNFVEGLSRGIKTYGQNLKTTFEMGTFFAIETAKTMQTVFSELFFDTMMDDLKSWSDYLRSILRGLSQMLAELLSQMLMMKVMSAGKFSFLKFALQTGISAAGAGITPVGATGVGAVQSPAAAFPMTFAHQGRIPLSALPRFHDGLFPNEMPAIIRKDESILTPEQMQGLTSGENYNIFINAVDASSFMDLTRRNPQAIIRPFVEAISNNDLTLRTSLKTAMGRG